MADCCLSQVQWQFSFTCKRSEVKTSLMFKFQTLNVLKRGVKTSKETHIKWILGDLHTGSTGKFTREIGKKIPVVYVIRVLHI